MGIVRNQRRKDCRRSGWFAAALAMAGLVVWLTGCATAKPIPTWDRYEMEGRGTKVGWRLPGLARTEARYEAMAQARRKIWDACLAERIDLASVYWADAALPDSPRVVSVEFLIVSDPVFESGLRALVGSLQPIKTTDLENGDLSIRLRLDRKDLLELVRPMAIRLRREQS